MWGRQVGWVELVPGQTLLRLCREGGSDVSGLAPYGACIGGDTSRSRRMDWGGLEAAKRADLGWGVVSGRFCDHGEYPDAHGNDHGRAAGISAVGGILPAGNARMELVAGAAAHRPVGPFSGRCGGRLPHAHTTPPRFPL